MQKAGDRVKKADKYNPYEDDTIHTTQSESHAESFDERQGFNDVMRHYDAVNGHQIPKRMDHFPGPIRIVLKLLIIIGVTAFLAFQVYALVEQFL